MENIVTIDNQQYKVESNVPLSQEQMKEYVMQKINNYNRNIATLATCPQTSKYVGQAITLTSTPTGGTSPYNIEFRRNGVAMPGGTFTGVTTATINYTLVAADSPSVPISVYITDSCPSGAKNNTDQCTITVGTCNVPNCGFSVA
jgi:hypothetical protein